MSAHRTIEPPRIPGICYTVSGGSHVAAPSPHPFERKFVEATKHLLIESTCALCGWRFIGSVSSGLEERERDHGKTCPNGQTTEPASHPTAD
jgi:hypothetical protein